MEVEYVARKVKQTDSPFGGLQIIVSADFYQLPPVKNEFDVGHYLFQVKWFRSVFPHIVILSEIVRQNEQDFI